MFELCGFNPAAIKYFFSRLAVPYARGGFYLRAAAVFFMNSFGFWWTVAILFTSKEITNEYVSYILTIITINFVEFIMTIYAAIQTRKGQHVRMAIFADFTDIMMRK